MKAALQRLSIVFRIMVLVLQPHLDWFNLSYQTADKERKKEGGAKEVFLLVETKPELKECSTGLASVAAGCVNW